MIRERLRNELAPVVIEDRSFNQWEDVFLSVYRNLGQYREVREYVESEGRVASFFLRAYEEDDGIYTEFSEFSSETDRIRYQHMFRGMPTRDIKVRGFVVSPVSDEIQLGTQFGQI